MTGSGLADDLRTHGFDVDRTGSDAPAQLMWSYREDSLDITIAAEALYQATGFDSRPGERDYGNHKYPRLSPMYRRGPSGGLDIVLVPDPEGTIFELTATPCPAAGRFAGGYHGIISAGGFIRPGPGLIHRKFPVQADPYLGGLLVSVPAAMLRRPDPSRGWWTRLGGIVADAYPVVMIGLIVAAASYAGSYFGTRDPRVAGASPLGLTIENASGPAEAAADPGDRGP